MKQKFSLKKNIKLIIISAIIILFIFYTNNIKNKNKIKFLYEINKRFNKEGKVNINEIESLLKKRNYINSKNNNNNIIHVGFTLDPGFLLQTMITIGSIMVTQNRQTKIVFHLGVTQNFTSFHMLKIYLLRNRLNNMTEFNFYYLKGATEKMKGFHRKGEACPGKFELPELLPDNIERLLLFDAGDVLIFRDLTELYNYDMKEFWVLGAPEPNGIFLNNNKYNITKYLNIGSLLLNVKKLKKYKFWNFYTEKKNLKFRGARDQSLFNILIPDIYKDYIPFRFGGLSPFNSDQNSDNLIYTHYGIKNLLKSNSSFPFPKISLPKITAQLYNPVFIHQWNGKWYKGKGLSIFRYLAKYFIKIAGVWDEICKIKPGYCI